MHNRIFSAIVTTAICTAMLLNSAQAENKSPTSSNESFSIASIIIDSNALNEAHDVELQDNFAYVAGKGSSIAIIDVANPEEPKIIWHKRDTELLHDSETVLLTPGRLFLGTDDFHSIDVSNPHAPVIDKTVKDRSKIETINGMVRRNNIIFSASKENFINAFDISNPKSPVLAGYTTTRDRYNLWKPHDVDLFGSHLVVVDPNDFGARPGNLALLRVFDENENLLPDSEWELDGKVSSEALYGANRVQVSGDFAFVAGSINPKFQSSKNLSPKGVVVDLSDPTSPKEVSFVTFPDLRGPNGLTVAGKVWFLAGGQTIQAYDISNPRNPRLLASVNSPEAFPTADDNAHDLVYRNGYLYVTGQGDNRFIIFKIENEEIIDLASNSKAMRLVSVLTHEDALNEAHDVELQGNLAFVPGKGGSIAIIDISEPREPEFVWFSRDQKLFSDSETVLLAPNRLFLGTDDFHSIDISNPRAPIVNKTIKDRTKISSINGMVRHKDIIFAASKHHFINAFDISDPASPILAGYANAQERFQLMKPHDVDLFGQDIVVVDPNSFGANPGGLALIRVLDESGNLLPDSEWKVTGRIANMDLAGANRVQVKGNYAFAGGSYMAKLSNGKALGKAVVVDLSNPSEPKQVAAVRFPDHRGPNGLTIAGNVWFLAGGRTIQAYDISDPTNPTLLTTFTSAKAFPTHDDNAHDLVYRNGFLYVSGQGDHTFAIIKVKDQNIRILAFDTETFGQL